jgi:hypothetical protein
MIRTQLRQILVGRVNRSKESSSCPYCESIIRLETKVLVQVESDLVCEGDKLKKYKADLETKKSRDKLITKLDEVDVLMRELIKEQIEKRRNDHLTESSWLSCLMRCRADIQSAITQLLGSYE